jgi:hypothetical protein
MKRRLGGVLIVSGAVSLLAGAARLTQSQEGAVCCAIVALDAARGTVSVRDNSGRATFLVTLADPRRMSGLRVGRAVGLTNESKALILYGAAGQAPQTLALSSLRLSAFAPTGSGTGAVGSAASSGTVPEGTWKRAPKGNCPRIKETAREQCVLTHQTGSYCEYFCVPIPNR